MVYSSFLQLLARGNKRFQ